MALVGVWIV